MRGKRDTTAQSAVARFMLASLFALAVVVGGGFFGLRSVTIREAERHDPQVGRQ